jgi:hypothetical protein
MSDLRKIYLDITGLKSIPQEQNNKESVQELIRLSGAPHDAVLEQLLEVEAEAPFRHLFLSRWSGQFSELESKAETIKAISENLNEYTGLSNLKCDYFKVDPIKITMTFSHDANSTHWTWRDGGRFPETVVVRHPFVFSFLKNQTLLITYPGFTFERGRSQPIEYYDIISFILHKLSSIVEIDYRPFVIKTVVESLLKKPSKRLNFIKLKSRSDRGTIDFESSTNELSIENLLPSLMVRYLPSGLTENQLRDAIINAIKDCDLRSSVIFWRDEKIATRLSYYDLGMELFITWKDEDPSYLKLTSIFDFLISLSLKYENDNSSVLDYFLTTTNDNVITRNELAGIVGMAASELDKELVSLVSQGILDTRYRLNLREQQSVLDYENSWKANIQLLLKEFKLADESYFDGKDPENIEVGFVYSSAERGLGLEL